MMQSVKDAMDGMDGLLALVDVTQVGEQDRKIVLEMGPAEGAEGVGAATKST